MLRSLSIRNLVLIDSLDLEFGPGLCVLTGETGAGKSILLDALGLALGARSDAQLVRHGAESASVSASFELAAGHPAWAMLKAQGFEPTDELILRRVLGVDGRSRAFANGQPASAAWLRKLGSSLVEIEGQSASGGLLDPRNHRALLDSFAANDKERTLTAATCATWRESVAALEKAEAELAEARRDEEYLRHVSAELEALAPQAGEEEKLATERRRLMNGQKLSKAMADARELIAGEHPAAASLRSATRTLEHVQEEAGGHMDAAIAALGQAAIEAAEAEAALAEAERGLDLDPRRLDAAEERLFALRAAARKHHTEAELLTPLLADFRRRLGQLDQGGTAHAQLSQASADARVEFLQAAQRLSTTRARAAKALDKALKGELAPLKLGGATFRTSIDKLEESQAGAAGLERVHFEITTNPGSPPGPLEKIASGGERARLLLALKVCLTRSKGVPSLVFDEVDEGVGGAVADAVGERLARLAQDVQVLVVTHSPQVAARGERHIRVLKESAKNSARAKVEILDGAARREEIARMLSGAQVTDEARAAAQSLIAGDPT
ncbi:MAG: DNA repair protein RecN [Proteobacteria bacterium]|nr:DNA repair protein RecN [Pseudomonadota bacterium]MDA1357173.1 DNA repair protein RecN [Pseudomonadota bacterium]